MDSCGIDATYRVNATLNDRRTCDVATTYLNDGRTCDAATTYLDNRRTCDVATT